MKLVVKGLNAIPRLGIPDSRRGWKALPRDWEE
jgi:hypothetical protein